MILETKNKLYLHYDQFEPKFFIDVRDSAEPVLLLPAWVRQAGIVVHRPYGRPSREIIHRWLHERLGNEWRQCRPNRIRRRHGEDGWWGSSVRSAPIGIEETGCFHTPLMDIDAIEVSDWIDVAHTGLRRYRVLWVIERKSVGEVDTDGGRKTWEHERRVLEPLRESGLPYRLVTR